MNRLSRCNIGLGTYVKITLEGENDDDELLEHSCAAFDAIERVHALMSFHDPASELSRVNQTAHRKAVSISPELRQVIAFSNRLSKETEGAFDLTVASGMVRRGTLPDHGLCKETQGNWQNIHLEDDQVRFSKNVLLDLGGVAKGFAVDLAFDAVPDSISVTIDAGGDLRMRPWQNQMIGIRRPGHPTDLVPVAMKRAAVATSSNDFRDQYHPIVSPLTDQPIVSNLSVSVFAPSCMVADALTKVAFLQPARRDLFLAHDAEVMMLDPNGVQLSMEAAHG